MQLRTPLWRPLAAAALAASLGVLLSCYAVGPAGDDETTRPADTSAGTETHERPAVPSDGDRLLLADWPGAAGGAVDRFDAALRAEGFVVVPSQRGGAESLSARDAMTMAELTFFPRESVTRVEILFRERDAG